MEEEKDYNIDFVLAYLDNTDPRWQELHQAYCRSGEGDIPARFRDWGWLRYWLRSIEKYAPWVHRIFIVSCNPCPTWLNADGTRLLWVSHYDYIPTEFLPTFNSHTIELNLHRLPGLSEHFVYFNDDMFLNASVSPKYYFQNGLPCDITNECLFYVPHFEDDNWGTQIIEYCNVGILKRHFNRQQVVKGNWRRWYGMYLPLVQRTKSFILSLRNDFVAFETPHNERPLLKSIFQEVWQAEHEYLRNSCTRFRESTNVNVYLMRLWHLASNRFSPNRERLRGQLYEILPETLDAICSEIQSGTSPSICLNDVSSCTDLFYETAKHRILETFALKYPELSTYEMY